MPMRMSIEQAGLFPDAVERSPRVLPVLGEQKDIVYHGTSVKSILNGPETTGMGFWSINPYTGCAFGCAYCYARYAHRYTTERVVSAGAVDEAVRRGLEAMPAWPALWRHTFLKE